MRKIGEYTVEATPIGIGGMGQILKGTDGNGHSVAIKDILPEFATNLEYQLRIEQEIKILWDLEHKNVVKILSSFLGNESDHYYIIMELVDGQNIEQYVQKNGAIPADQAVKMMVELLDVMQYVHTKGYIHRDIKPSNVMIRENMQICLLDFGVARDTNSTTSLTNWGTIIGTDGYMSPEQAEGFAIDWRSDIYALGCVFYYMLTGHHAYNTLSSEFETKEAILKEDFPRLSKYLKNADERLQLILDRATDKNMTKRYQSCSDFSKALRNSTIVSAPSSASTPTQDIVVTIGSEMCDIIITDPGRRISRHHADVSLKVFTGSRYYVFTDTSANGTLINGKKICKQSVTIKCDDTPEIFLARLTNAKLDWDQVKNMLDERARALGHAGVQTGGSVTPPPSKPSSNKTLMILLFVASIIITILLTILVTLLVI